MSLKCNLQLENIIESLREEAQSTIMEDFVVWGACEFILHLIGKKIARFSHRSSIRYEKRVPRLPCRQ